VPTLAREPLSQILGKKDTRRGQEHVRARGGVRMSHRLTSVRARAKFQ
jgi:hypothetical protein